MKERILVKYSYQNDHHDKSQNCFFFTKDSDSPLSIIELLSQFPGFWNGELQERGYHFRFLDRFGKNTTCWVDINNLSSAVPIHKNVIEMKVLIMPTQRKSNIYHDVEERCEAFRAERDAPVPIETKTTKPVHENKNLPERTKQPLAKLNVQDESDLLGGLDILGGNSKKTPSTTPNTKPQQASSKGREENEINVLDIDQPTQGTGNTPGNTDNSKLAEMFSDFDPTVRNRVLDVIEIQEREKRQAKERVDALEAKTKKMAEDQDAKNEAGLQIEPKIKAWAYASNNARNNIRILLSTLHNILWEGSDWEPKTVADMMTDISVKKVYMKAILIVHPDHNSDVTDPTALYMMDRVFNILNDSYAEFTKNKGK